MWKGNWPGNNGPSTAAQSNNAITNGRTPLRNQVTPRSSSLNLVNNSSASSLPTGGGGGGLRRQISNASNRGASLQVRDPVQVLSRILGVDFGELAALPTTNDEIASKPELVEDVDFGGLSLEEYANQQEEEEEKEELSVSVAEDYEREKEKFEDLNKSIKKCDEVLQEVEFSLSAFQADLGKVSSEIESLQNRSSALNRRLENRKAAEQVLGPIVEDIGLSPAVVRKISEGEVNDSWLKALKEVDIKAKQIDGYDEANVKAVKDVKPEIEKLTNKAIERARDYFVTRIKSLRAPHANAQVIQQAGFMRFKDLFHFINDHQPQLAEEVCHAYINTMRWYYLNHFQRYRTSLERLKLYQIEKEDTIGREEVAKRTILLPTLKASHALPHDPFSLSRRSEILDATFTQPPLRSTVFEEEKQPHYLEYPFRHFNLALIENGSAEYSFITDFFSYKTYHEATQIFNRIFTPTLTLGQAYTKQLVHDSTDCLGILCCVRLTQQFAFELQRRRVPVFESYINATNMLLWPRFQIGMDRHADSLRNYRIPSSLPNNVAPAQITQKFASFLHAILTLSAPHPPPSSTPPQNLASPPATSASSSTSPASQPPTPSTIIEEPNIEPIKASLGRLRSEYEALLTKLSQVVAGKDGASGGKRERFLGNNYSLVGTILADVEDGGSRIVGEVRSHFEGLAQVFRGG